VIRLYLGKLAVTVPKFEVASSQSATQALSSNPPKVTLVALLVTTSSETEAPGVNAHLSTHWYGAVPIKL
jgi:hypothetical protein